jgi:hypothetical protein
VLLLLLAGALPRRAADPHADESRSCVECHSMHYSRAHNYDGTVPPAALTPGGPFTYLLENDVATYIVPSVYSGATLNGPASRLAAGVTRTPDSAPAYVKTLYGRLAVSLTATRGIELLNDKGMPLVRLTHFVTDAAGARRPGEPTMAALRRDCAIYVIDALADGVDVLDMRGRVTRTLQPADIMAADRRTVRPTRLAIDSFDAVYVAMGGAESAIVVYPTTAAAPRVIGRMAGGTLNDITDLTIDATGKIAATYGAAQLVRTYAATGALLDTSSTLGRTLGTPRLR